MASISQKITSYIHGISQQPDHLKRPGQVRHILNGLPDITEGLTKRPGSQTIAQLGTDDSGKWFTIFRDNTEKYICQISNGAIKIWSLLDGLPRVVRYNSTPDLTKPDDGGVGIQPDFDYDSDGTAPPTGGTSPVPGTCNLAALTKASNDVVDANAKYASKKAEYDLAVAELNRRKADRKVETYVPATVSTGARSRVLVGWMVWNLGPPTPVNLPANHIRMAEKRASDPMVGYPYLHWAVGFYAWTGTYTQVQIDAAQTTVDTKWAELSTIQLEVETKKAIYRYEASNCSTTSVTAEVERAVAVPYLSGTSSQDIEVLTLNDYTFLVNKKTVVTMGKGSSPVRPYEAFVEIKAIEYNTEYSLTITRPSVPATTAKSYATSLVIEPADWSHSDGNCPYTNVATYDRNAGSKINLRYTIETRGTPIPNGQYDYDCQYRTYVTLLNGGENWVTGDTWTQTMGGKTYTIKVASHGIKFTYDTIVPITPYLTPKDPNTGIIKVDSILTNFKTQIEAVSGWSATIIGNGLYIKGPVEFSIYTAGGRADASIDCFTNKVNNISKLPVQCKDGYVVQVVNTGEIEDDYYVKFVGTKVGVNGAGTWEETVAPGITVNLNYTTMPHQIVRMPDGTFMMSPVQWEDRLVGDRKSNPVPSFVGNKVNKMFFYRNRLGILSGENVVLSRAGDFFNFFAKTALTVSEADPIDLAASSTTPCVLHDAVPLNPGLILFSRDKQFILTTTQDLLTPTSTKLDVLSTYNCSELIPAFEMGTTVGFLGTAGRFSRMWEMTGLNRVGTPDVIEQSKIVQELLPTSITDIANSKDNSLVVFAERGSDQVYLYRYFNDGEKRVQSAWFQWSLPGQLIHHAVDQDTYYYVCKTGTKIYLAKSSVIPVASDKLVVSDVTYAPRMDLLYIVPNSSITYNSVTNRSSFLVPYEYSTSAYAFGLGYGRFQGRGVPVLSSVAEAGKWRITIEGDWSDNYVAVGYQYTMKVVLPHCYYSKTVGEKNVTNTNSYTNVHRMKLEFGKVGYFDILVKKKSKADYVLTYEQAPADSYPADTHEVQPSAMHTVPIYEKNTNAYVELSSTYPTPCTLLSSQWEGTVSTAPYRSV